MNWQVYFFTFTRMYKNLSHEECEYKDNVIANPLYFEHDKCRKES